MDFRASLIASPKPFGTYVGSLEWETPHGGAVFGGRLFPAAFLKDRSQREFVKKPRLAPFKSIVPAIVIVIKV
jgi:hypothetical protein